MDTDDKSVLEDMFRREENKIEAFSRRLYLIEAVQNEITTVTRRKRFKIWNDLVWMMVLDTRDAFVIHFASWLRGVTERGGLLRQIQAHHVRRLRRKWKSDRYSDHELLRSLLAHKHEETFARLFPEVTAAFPRPEDVERVRSDFHERFAPITRFGVTVWAASYAIAVRPTRRGYGMDPTPTALQWQCKWLS